MSQIFNLNIRKLSVLLTPTFLRKERFLAWTYCLVYPLEFVYDKFLKHRTDDLYKMAHTLQHTQIDNDDACKIIKLRDTEYTFHYVDPPYVGANQGHYGGYTQEHFEELLNTLSQCKGKFLLSSYHNEALTTFVKEFGWYQKEIALHLGSSKTKGKKRVEVLTANYPI